MKKKKAEISTKQILKKLPPDIRKDILKRTSILGKAYRAMAAHQVANSKRLAKRRVATAKKWSQLSQEQLQVLMDSPGDPSGSPFPGEGSQNTKTPNRHNYNFFRPAPQVGGIKIVPSPHADPVIEAISSSNNVSNPDWTVNIGQDGHSILGHNFGKEQGTLTLVVDNVGSFDLTVDYWGEGYVIFFPEDDITGIPFGATGYLKLTRTDGRYATKPVQITPASDLFLGVSPPFSDSCESPNLNSLNKRVNFTSPTLPESFKPFQITTNGITEPVRDFVIMKIDNFEVFLKGPLGSQVDLGEGDAHYGNVDDPVINPTNALTEFNNTAGKASIWATIQGGMNWNFTATADFFILIPNGFDSTGWASTDGIDA